MSAVDVLAVMDRNAQQARDTRVQAAWSPQSLADADQLDKEARAAVAELTDGARSAEATLQRLVEIGRLPANNKGLRDVRAALARIGGAA